MLPATLPKDVRRRAVQPPGLPDGDFAWTLDDALAVLETLAGTVIAVLQVEAYVVLFGHQDVVPTGRRAIYAWNPGELAAHFAQRSRQAAEEFIRAGSRDEIFAIVFSGQDDAEAGHGTAKLRAG